MKKALTTAIGLALAAFGSGASAVTDTQINSFVPFSFASPGARSLGMAGAFLGLADDATAAYTNPAGLTQLRQTEISLEARHTKFDTPFASGGTFTEAPFSAAGVGTGHTSTSKNNPSYLSVVFPHDRWALAFYRHELSRYDTSFTNPDPIKSTDPNSIYLFPFIAQANLKIVNYGASAAFKASDNFSIGLGLSRYNFQFKTSDVRFDTVDNQVELQSAQRQEGDDNAFGVNLGARWSLSDSLSLGVVYRRVPKFEYDAVSVLLEPNGDLREGTSPRFLDNVRFDVPDIWGAGLSWRPNDAWLLSFDLDRVKYSQLTDGVESLFGLDSSAANLRIPDGTEIHLGTEYTWANMAHPFSLRGGVWRDPRHTIRFDGTPSAACSGTDEAACGDIALAALFSKGRGPETHWSLGGGMAFKSFQIDLAADFSKSVDIWSLSGVYRF